MTAIIITSIICVTLLAMYAMSQYGQGGGKR